MAQSKTLILKSIGELKKNMVIEAYTGFSNRYQTMEESVCSWVKLNFRGARAYVIRDGKMQNCSIEDLKPGDTICRLYKFPKTLQKLKTVTPKLVLELQRRGFKQFIIKRPSTLPSQKQMRRYRQVQEANELVHSVKKNFASTESACSFIEEAINRARKGTITSFKSVKSFIEQLFESDSAGAMAVIANLRESDQTYAHCVDVAAYYQLAYFKIKEKRKEPSLFQSQHDAITAAFLHDYGKATIPRDILESTTQFAPNSQEMAILQTHPTNGAIMLQKMGLKDHIVNMALHHHIKQDVSLNSSYPVGIPYNNVATEARLLSIIDVFQALVGRRSYKKSWAPAAAIRYIDSLTGIEYDPDIWNEFAAVIGKYPQGSLVELNDGSIAFVIKVNDSNPNNPIVVIAKDRNGKDVQTNTMIDLQEEPEINITRDIDHYKIFGDEALERFMQLEVV